MPTSGRLYRFGSFTLDGSAYRLHRGGTPLALSPKLVDLLLYLVERSSKLATKEELFNAIWPDVTVTENALTQAISELRQALGDDPATPTFIQTVARRGYRFVAAVETVAEHPPPAAGEPPVRRRVRETRSLDAYRAFSEGRVQLEALDAALVSDAIQQFERAIAIDPQYAAAHVGLANARFWQYEMSRDRNRPESTLLATAIDHARQAIDLDEHMADAQATLALLLVSAGRAHEARAAALKAVELEPFFWGHHFRLGHATWGDERLRALSRALELYPEFPYVHFEMAMVHIARGELAVAEQVVREGVVIQDRQADRRERFPARGLHWLLALIRLAKGDVDEALRECDAERTSHSDQLYAREFSVAALNAKGLALLARGDAAAAVGIFRDVVASHPDHARSHAGLALALRRDGHEADAEHALAQARAGAEQLRRGGRMQEAMLVSAFDLVMHDRFTDAIAAFDILLVQAPPGFTGWTIPIEPCFFPLRELPAFRAVLRTLADRAK